MNRKKRIAVLFSFIMIFAVTACGNSAGRGEQDVMENPSAEINDDTGEESNTSQDIESVDTTEAQPAEGEASEEQRVKILVAYFSATNTTAGVAEHIADGLNADLYEIVPEEPYTDEDLNYNDNDSRSTIEMDDPSARPAISGSVEDMAQYDIVFLGFPIWWGDAPRILSTFVESYDFTGKTVVPFCTSGGSGVGSSASNLEKLTDGATWLEGRRLSGGDSQETVMEWVEGLGLPLSAE